MTELKMFVFHRGNRKYPSYGVMAINREEAIQKVEEHVESTMSTKSEKEWKKCCVVTCSEGNHVVEIY